MMSQSIVRHSDPTKIGAVNIYAVLFQSEGANLVWDDSTSAWVANTVAVRANAAMPATESDVGGGGTGDFEVALPAEILDQSNAAYRKQLVVNFYQGAGAVSDTLLSSTTHDVIPGLDTNDLESIAAYVNYMADCDVQAAATALGLNLLSPSLSMFVRQGLMTRGSSCC